MKHTRFSTKLSNSTSAPEASGSGSSDNAGSAPLMTDDSGSTDSPVNDSPTTPPTTPPMGDMGHKRDSGMWKKLGRLSKVGKKKSDGKLKEEQ